MAGRFALVALVVVEHMLAWGSEEACMVLALVVGVLACTWALGELALGGMLALVVVALACSWVLVELV